MKLLFDPNLSPRLETALSDRFPGSRHVREAGLERASDSAVWAFAVAGGFTIVSKDSDFRQRSFLLGHPPKVVWVRRGNCSTRDVEAILRAHIEDLVAFGAAAEASFLALE